MGGSWDVDVGVQGGYHVGDVMRCDDFRCNRDECCIGVRVCHKFYWFSSIG